MSKLFRKAWKKVFNALTIGEANIVKMIAQIYFITLSFIRVSKHFGCCDLSTQIGHVLFIFTLMRTYAILLNCLRFY